MEQWERDYHVSRIIAGATQVKVRNRNFILASPSREHRLLANEVFKDAWQESHLVGVLTYTEIRECLIVRGLWSAHDEEQLKLLTEKIEDFKVGLYENWADSGARFQIRHALDKGRAEATRLEGIRHSLDHITCDGIATSAKIRCLIGCSIKRGDGTPYWDDPLVCLSEPDDILEQIIEQVLINRLNEAETRELSRNEPWRSIWSARQYAGNGLFGAPAVDLTDEQRTISLWSSIYDSIKEHPECPADDIIDDDDMIDGWLILQRRKREESQAKKRGDEITNAKIRDADEVYILSSAEDAHKVGKLNDINAQNIKAARMAFLKQRGQVNEVHMPDTQQKFQMEMARLEAQKFREGS